MEHKLAYVEAKADPFPFYGKKLMILTKYVFDVSVRLTEYSVTVESVTLRFYCTCNCLVVFKLQTSDNTSLK